jgi:ATP-dependent Clp protease adapter protein ClpS
LAAERINWLVTYRAVVRIGSCAVERYEVAFVVVLKIDTRTHVVLLRCCFGQPETQIKTGVKIATTQKQKRAQKQKEKTEGPVSQRKEEFEDAPMYKLMLLQDDGADVGHVITRLCAICEDMDEDQASTVFQQAQAAGKAMCGKYPFERAELFKEQLLRSTPMIFADMEEE